MSDLPDIIVSAVDYQFLSHLTKQQRQPPKTPYDLAGELSRAHVLPPDAIPDSVATMHSRVRYQNLYAGGIYEGLLVYPNEAKGNRGAISILSPIGTALLGLAVGDRIAWPVSDEFHLMLKVLEVEQHRYLDIA